MVAYSPQSWIKNVRPYCLEIEKASRENWDEIYVVGPAADYRGQPSDHPSLKWLCGIYYREPKLQKP
jgi:hypothetical protein